MAAKLAQRLDVVLILEEKPLNQKRRIQPGAIQILDKHPEPEVLREHLLIPLHTQRVVAVADRQGSRGRGQRLGSWWTARSVPERKLRPRTV